MHLSVKLYFSPARDAGVHIALRCEQLDVSIPWRNYIACVAGHVVEKHSRISNVGHTCPRLAYLSHHQAESLVGKFGFRKKNLQLRARQALLLATYITVLQQIVYGVSKVSMTMMNAVHVPPVLSTPDTHILNDTTDVTASAQADALSDEQIQTRYEIARTIREIRENKWRRIALQFPDEMLPHSARVYQMLARGLRGAGSKPAPESKHTAPQSGTTKGADRALSGLSLDSDPGSVKLTILADTSYGSCCVDEIAGEHVDADAVVHYGRACLSPTARLPVVYVHTKRDLHYDQAVESFMSAFPDHNTKVVVTADMPYASHVQPLCTYLAELGYDFVFVATIIHDPSSLIPNRTVPSSVAEDPTSLKDWHLFHIAEPPTSLLLSMTSRMASVVVHPTSDPSSTSSAKSTALLLRRRYALITSLATVPIWGILINTLSVKNYLSMITHVQRLISDAGRKSYLFVVGKINAAKVANFSEIGGWVVIGCWESSLIDSKEFYKPIITPFELELALRPDESRVWTGEWRADFEGVLEASERGLSDAPAQNVDDEAASGSGLSSEEDSDEAPEFDLRTGRYMSRARPIRRPQTSVTHRIENSKPQHSSALSKRANCDILSVNGIASPAADFLAKQRSWRGLGSDFEVRYEDQEEEGALIEEGQTGVAGGYAVGESEKV